MIQILLGTDPANQMNYAHIDYGSSVFFVGVSVHEFRAFVYLIVDQAPEASAVKFYSQVSAKHEK
jgi:hypothetical protein